MFLLKYQEFVWFMDDLEMNHDMFIKVNLTNSLYPRCVNFPISLVVDGEFSSIDIWNIHEYVSFQTSTYYSTGDIGNCKVFACLMAGIP